MEPPASQPNEEPQGSLARHLARYYFAAGTPRPGAQLDAYVTALERSAVRYAGDYPLYLRKQRLALAAEEYAAPRLWPETLEARADMSMRPRTAAGSRP